MLCRVLATHAPASSAFARELVGWTPEHETLAGDLRRGDYFDPEASVRTEAVWLS